MNIIIEGSANAGFLKDAVNGIQTYWTPKKIVDYVESERLKAIIINPPYNVENL